MLSIGIDSGTQSTKTIVLDSESGQTLVSAHRPHSLIGNLPPGHLEQDPQAWLDAADETVRECLAQLGGRKDEVVSVGISGQQHGLVALNQENQVLRPAKLWCDTSTLEQCEQFNAEFGGAKGLIELAGNAMLPGYTAPKILWLKQNEPHHYASARCFLLPHDYLNFWLTGEKRMEYGDASGTGLMEIRTRQWCKPLCEFIDSELTARLPALQSSRKAVGALRNGLREQWGLKKSPTVSAGGGDNMMGAIGTGNLSPGVFTVSLGTSGTLYSYSDRPIIDPEGEVAAFCDSTDAWLPLVCTMNVTVATEKVRQMFGWDHQRLEAEVAAAPAGADGALFLPYLNGERTPNLPKGCAVLYGLNAGNLAPGHLARAALEGVTLGIAYGLRRFRQLKVEPNEIRLTGGGSRSAVWRQICADTFGVPTVCPVSSEGAALGAAIQALWAHENSSDHKGSLLALTNYLVRLDESTRCEPDQRVTKLYAERLAKQSEVTSALHGAGLL